MANDDGGGFTLPSVLKEFAADPAGFIWGIILTGLVAFWQEILDAVDMYFDRLAMIPRVALLEPARAAYLPIAQIVFDLVWGFQSLLASLAAPAGVLAPVVVVVGWGSLVILVVTIIRVVLAFIPIDISEIVRSIAEAIGGDDDS